MNLRLFKLGVRASVENSQSVMIRTIGAYELGSRGRIPGEIRVCKRDAKIGAVGGRISVGVTYFRFSISV